MFKGKTILITGSSHPNGIGFATAKLVKEYGGIPILHGKEESEGLKENAKELGVEYVFFDVGNQEEVSESINQLEEKGLKIDGLAHCAGAVNPKPFLETKEDNWLFSYKTNVLGTVFVCQSLISHMKKNGGGRIVTIGSVRAYPQGTFASRLAYSSSKAAVLNITTALAKEYAQDKIYINSVSPGGVDTDIARTWDEVTRKRNSNVLLERLGNPAEIGETICFLLSEKSSFTTGQDFVIDGGYLIGKN